MTFHRFMTFDPYLSFAQGGQGFADKVFIKPDGSPTETWYGAERDGKGYLASIWRIGRDAYATVAAKLEREPNEEDFEEIAKSIQNLERDLVPSLQPLVDDGLLILHQERGDPPLTCLKTAIKDAPDGWLLEVYMRMTRSSVVSGHLAEDILPDFEGLLCGAAVKYLDDYIIAHQLGHDVDEAFELVMVNISSARLFRETVEAAKEAVSSVGRRSANARHKPTNERKRKAIDEWEAALADSESRNAKRPTMAGFARKKHEEYFVTSDTVRDWIRAHEKTKK